MSGTRNRRNRPGGAMRAVTYGRVSTGRQADSGLGLDDQAERVAEVCARRGFQVVAEYVDPGRSGKRGARRPQLDAALATLDAGDADVLVCAKLDRLSRSTGDMARILDRAEDRGWKVVILDADVDTTQASGRLLADVLSAAAQFEAKRIGERVAAAHRQLRRQGRRSGQRPLLDDNLRRQIAHQRAAGATLTAIANDLTTKGVATAKGGRWYPSTVAHVVRSVALDDELLVSAERRPAAPSPQ